MKILICSDSHGNNEVLDKIVKKFPNMDLYLHAGDSESSEYLIQPFLSVKGNCDYFSDFPERRIIDTPLGALLIQHNPVIDNTIIQKYQIKFFIYGHTHRRHHEKRDDLLIINPGAISFARDNNYLSFAILEIDMNNSKVCFYSLDN